MVYASGMPSSPLTLGDLYDLVDRQQRADRLRHEREHAAWLAGLDCRVAELSAASVSPAVSHIVVLPTPAKEHAHAA